MDTHNNNSLKDNNFEKNNQISTLDKMKMYQEEEARLKTLKLEKECKFLEYQISRTYKSHERFKALSGVASILTAIIAVGTIVFSVIKWTDDNKLARQANEEEQFFRLSSAMQDPVPQKRLNAAVSLKSYFKKDDPVRNSQAIQSLINAITFEKDGIALNGFLEVLHSINFELIDTFTLKDGLTSLVKMNRILTKNYRLLQSDSLIPPDILNNMRGISNAISIFFKKNVKVQDLSELFVYETDLSSIEFLPKTNFEKTALVFSNFQKSTCVNCLFKEANLSGSSFTAATLQNSDFSFLDRNDASLMIYYNLQGLQFYNSPSFDSADLAYCNFTYYPIFFLENDESKVKEFLEKNWVNSGTMRGANIANADFTRSEVFRFTTGNRDLDEPGTGTGTFESTDFQLKIESWPLDQLNCNQKPDQYFRFKYFFQGCRNWKIAKLPSCFREIM